LLLSIAMLGFWRAGPVTVATGERCHHLRVATMILGSNGPCYVTLAYCYYDRTLLPVIQSSNGQSITIFSLSSVSNTLIIGLPLLVAMYGPYSDGPADLMVQVVILQCIVWYPLLLVLFELRATRMLIVGAQCMLDATSNTTVHMHPGVVLLDGSQADAVADVALARQQGAPRRRRSSCCPPPCRGRPI
jgi:hypothetical protein